MFRLDKYSAGFDRGAPVLKEGLWWVVRALFFLPPLPIPSALRVAMLRMFGARIGSGVVIRHGVNISFPWRFRCGDHVWLGEESRFLSLAEISLGSHVCVSQEAFLCTGSHNPDAPGFDLITKPITVGDYSWIAARAFIAPGVTIRRGCVIAACAVVVKSLDDGARVGGNPARELRTGGDQ